MERIIPMNISHCPYCGNKKTRYHYGTVCETYSCKCGADMILDIEFNEELNISVYVRKWVKDDE